MLNDVLVVGLAIGTWLALGYPVARKLGPFVVWPALAAPPLGLALLALLTVVLYASGLRIETAFKVCLVLGTPGIVLAVRDGLRASLPWSYGAFLLILVTATLLVLLPKWLAPPEFSIFQANFDDQFFYLTQAWKGSLFDYATIQGLDPDMDFDTQLAKGVMGLPMQITARPGAALMLAGFATMIHQPILLTSYAYLAALQLCFFFAALFLLRNVIELANALSLFLALGVTVGFFLQYAFDTNAWSTLAALPVITLYTGLLILGLAAHDSGKANQATPDILGKSGFFWSMLVCAAGFAYIYPEIASLAVAISVPIVAYQYFTSEDRSCFLSRLRLAVLAGVGALALCALAWPMTFGFILTQRRVLADPSIFVYTVSWFQNYLVGYDSNPGSNFAAYWQIPFWDYLHQIVSVATSFSAGMLGVYFLQPSADTALGVRIVWKLALFLALASVLGFWLWGLLRPSREFRVWKQRALFVGVLSGLALVAGLRWSGQIYPAYKALTWLSPLLILAIIGPLLSDRRNPSLIKAVALCYVGTQLFFGGYRSYAAAHDDHGIHYRPPYPLDPTQKRIYRWDYAGLQSALSHCSRVRIDLDDAPLESFVKMVVTDMGIHWSSPHILWGSGHRQIDNPDCTVTTIARGIQPDHTIIWLRRDDSLPRFYRGELDRLLLVPNLLPALETQGFTGETPAIGGEARTKGRAAIRVPNNPEAPIKRLTMTIGLEQAAEIHVAVRINGRPVLDEVASRGSSGSDWSKTVELPDFGAARWLSVVIASDTRGVTNDAWPLRIRLLALER